MDLFEEMKKKKKTSDRNYIARQILKFASGADVLVEPTVQALKKEKSNTVKYTLLKILSKIGTDSAIEGLKQMAYDNEYIAKTAVSYIGNFKTASSSQALREIVLTTKNEECIRRALPLLFGRIISLGFESEGEKNLDAILEVVKKFKYESLKSYISSLGNLSRKGYNEKIMAVLKDISNNHRNSDFRREAAETIEKASIPAPILNIIQIGNKECEIDKNGRLEIKTLREGVLPKVDWGNYASKVEVLNVQNSLVKSLSGIEALIELKKISIGIRILGGREIIRQKSKLEDISALSHCPKLITLELSMNNISNLDGIANHPNLRFIDLSDNEIEKIEGLTNVPKVLSLNLSKNKIKEISGLDGLTNLNHLDLSYNKITQIKGLQNLKHLITINLEGNLYLPKANVNDAQKLVAQCAGVSLGPEEPKDFSKPHIRPLKHILLEENVEDHCLYCKNPVPSDGNQQVKCENKLKKIVFSANSKIPKSKTEYSTVEAPQSRQVIGYKRTPNPYDSFRTYTVRTGGKTEKTKRKVSNLNGKLFSSLAGTVCEACSEKFLESVDKILKRIAVKGSAEAIYKSISNVEENYNSLIINWMSKI